jgi:hypothetical protein
MIDVSVRDGTYIITLPTSVLVLTQAELIHALRQGIWWHRRQGLARRQATRHGGAPPGSDHG